MPEVLGAMEAALTRHRGRARRRPWLRRGLGLGLVALLGSGTALAATGAWNPFGTDHRDAYTLAPAPAADQATLAVLRRPQTITDENPLMTAFLRSLAKHDEVRSASVGRVYLRSIRYLRTVETGEMGGWNGTVHRTVRRGIMVIVPSDLPIRNIAQVVPGSGASGPRRSPDLGPNATSPRPTEHQLCVDTLYDSWPVHGPAPMVLSAPGPKHATGASPKPTRPPLLEDRVTGGGTCVPLHDLRTKGIVQGAFDYGALTGVVPDGVATVRVTTRTGRVVTDRVVNNAFELLAPGHERLVKTTLPDGRTRTDMPAKSAQFKHQTLQWVAADGRIVRRVPR